MLYKSLISFIAAFAVASGVAVSANPVARGGGSSQCNTGSVQCCDQLTTGGSPKAIAAAKVVGITVGADVTVGLNCVSVVSAVQCNNSPVCCQNVYQQGLINVACTPINVGA